MKKEVPLEKVAERAFKKMAKNAGCIVRKFNSQRDDPDLIVLLPRGKVMFFEFKRQGAVPRPGQMQRHEEMHALGHTVHVVTDAYEAFQLLRIANL